MFMDEYQRWLDFATEDPDLIPELSHINGNSEEIKDRFAINLSFGTAGLRGVIGAGTNRMNIYTVRKATQGLAAYLLKTEKKPSVAISYDSRIKSTLFAKQAACVLAANGIRTYIYPTLEPVPALSFAVRALKTSAGVMITASHNPAKYNGYKAYGPDGCQMTSEAADAVLAEIELLDIFKDLKTLSFEQGLEAGLISYIPEEVLEAFYTAVKAQSIRPGLAATAPLKLVYSPLNGTGNVPVRRILADVGFTDITVVPEQELPDGNFPTCPYPNPEIREALALGLALAEKVSADLMLATDPDADRVGIAVRDETGSYHLLSGNEVGVLLLDYICKGRLETGTMPQNPVMVKSVVSTPMADEVAAHYNVQAINVLTGFKYIGEQILKLEEKGEENRFILGFEESYGYLPGSYVRDKDAVAAALLICEMAAWYNAQGSSLYEAMQNLYKQYGFFLNKVDSFEFEGLSGMEKMASLMDTLRQNPPRQIAGLAVTAIADYENHTVVDTKIGAKTLLDLPSSNILSYTLEGGSTIVVRPSGTEPKIKVYYTTKGQNTAEAEALRQKLAAAMRPLLA
ncbi:MAG: phospho-sugar mutase [Oscillospiraceae bacterium]